MNILFEILIGIVVFNLLMLSWSLIELWQSRLIKDPWLMSEQVLVPESGITRATVILIHGFIDSPLGVKPLALKLQQEGFRVVVPVMPFQAAHYWAFARGRFTAAEYITWLESTIENEAGPNGEKPFLVGFSMGGTLAIITTARKKVAGTVLLAPYFGVRIGTRLLGKMAQWLRWVIPVIPSILGRPINDPKGRRRYRPGSVLISVGAFYQLERLRRVAVDSAAKIQTSVAVFAAPRDRVAAYGMAEKVWKGHPRAKWYIQPRANHVLCFDFDAEWMFNEAVRFFKAI